MAIYELSQVCEAKRGGNEKKDKCTYTTDGKYPSISAGIQYKGKIDCFNRDGLYTCISSSGANAGHITIIRDKFYAADCFTIQSKVSWLKQEFLNYFFLKNAKKIRDLQLGAAQPHVYWKDVKRIRILIPKLIYQKQIIDIIEPIDNLLFFCSNIIQKINFCTKYALTKFYVEKSDYSFIKGENPILGKKNTPFLNVSAANSKINRWVENQPNIKKGDITLSLDGNLGLVNNFLEGFNGYLYKVVSKTRKNYQIYYSLRHKINQKIIKLNATGTTIKHSPASKKNIKHIRFELDNFLRHIFKLECFLKEMILKAQIIRSKSISILVK